MPLRNRVDPRGRIVADPARGALLGNRGILHYESGTVFACYWALIRVGSGLIRRDMIATVGASARRAVTC